MRTNKKYHLSKRKEGLRRWLPRRGKRPLGPLCAQCGKPREHYAPQQKFCSPACRQRAFYWDFKMKTGKRYQARGKGKAGKKGNRGPRRRKDGTIAMPKAAPQAVSTDTGKEI